MITSIIKAVRNLVTRRTVKVLVMAFVVAVLSQSVIRCGQEHAARVSAEKRVNELIVLNDSTQARLSLGATGRKELTSLKAAAKEMGGTVVAGVKIHVRPDTVYVPVREVTTSVDASGTRTAVLEDSTAGYKVTVTGKAPATGPLQLGYTLVTPDFHPEVGFIQKGKDYYATVSWAGHTVETSEAFFKPPAVRPVSVVAGAEARTVTETQGGSVQGQVYIALQHQAGTLTTQLRAGYDGHSFVGVSFNKKLL